jgi:PHD/YefM family antitoxin component YafN of YafNO toxin-antitoxin module
MKLHNILHIVLRNTLEIAMAEVSSAEVQRNFGVYREKAEGTHGEPEPVMVMHYNKPSVVIVAASEYARLKRRDKRVLATEDLPEWLANQIGTAEMDPRFAHLDEAG